MFQCMGSVNTVECGFDSRQRTELFQCVAVKRQDGVILLVSGVGHRDLPCEQTVGIEARVDGVEVGERPDHQSGADDQDEGRGHFGHDEPASHAAALADLRSAVVPSR